MNPKKFGSLANHKQEPWKAPLPVFVADLYRKRFGKDRPDDVRPLEEIVADRKRKKAERKAAHQQQAVNETTAPEAVNLDEVPF